MNSKLTVAAAAIAYLARLEQVEARNNLARVPPMGWMSWEIFRCNLNTTTDDCTDPTTTNCISEALYQGQADAMVSGGFAAAGYASIHMDGKFVVANSISSLTSSSHLCPPLPCRLLGRKKPTSRPRY